MLTSENKADLRVVLYLVDDAYSCLDHAYREIGIRQIPNVGFAIGAIGAAQGAVRFVSNILRAAVGDPPAPKRVRS